MQFVLNRARVIPVISQSFQTSENKTTDDINSYFLFKATGDCVKIISMNQTCEQEMILPIEEQDIKNDFSFFIQAYSLVEFLRQFPDEQIFCKYNSKSKKLIIESHVRKLKAEFTCIPEDTEDATLQYIPINYTPTSNPISIDGRILSRILKMVSFATAQDASFSPLTSVRICIKENQLVAQSSDTSRISVSSGLLEDNVLGEVDILLPRISADILSDILENVSSIQIESGKRHIKFYTQEFSIISRLEDGLENFPDVEQYFNGNKIANIKVSRKDTLRAIKMVGLFSKDSYINISLDNDNLYIEHENKTNNKIKDSVSIQEYVGDKIDNVILSHKFLLKSIETAREPWTDIEFIDISLGEDSVVAMCVKEQFYKHLIFPVQPN